MSIDFEDHWKIISNIFREFLNIRYLSKQLIEIISTESYNYVV